MSVELANLNPEPNSGIDWHIGHSLADLFAATSILDSPEPSAVFAELADISVEDGACDYCKILLAIAGQPTFQITRSATSTTEPGRIDEHPATVFETVPIVGVAVDGYPDYSGEMVLGWDHTAEPHAHAVIELLVDRAVTAIQVSRLAERLTIEQHRIVNLEIALASNRDIGAAVGILMARYVVTREDAFALLSKESQRSRRKLSQVALDVMYEGDLT